MHMAPKVSTGSATWKGNLFEGSGTARIIVVGARVGDPESAQRGAMA